MRGMEMHAHVPKIGKTAVHWLLEGLFIVMSVALGFGMAQFRESRLNHELAARVLKELQTEVEHNLSIVEPQITLHQRWVASLSTWLKTHETADTSKGTETARDVFMATWPDLNLNQLKHPFPHLQRVAWDAALSTGALRLIDYDVASGLSEIYQWQDAVQTEVEKLPTSQTAFFEPASQRAAVFQLAFGIDAVVLTEGFLLQAYHRHLPAIRSAANSDR